MFTKGNTHYADWREADGTRRRKAFNNKRDAAAHEKAMKLNANPQKARAAQARYSRRTSGPSDHGTIVLSVPAKSSQPPVVISSRANGGPVTSPKQSR